MKSTTTTSTSLLLILLLSAAVISCLSPVVAMAEKTIEESESVEESPAEEGHREAVADAEDHGGRASEDPEVYNVEEEGEESSAEAEVESSHPQECPVDPINKEICGGPNQGKCDSLTGSCECKIPDESSNEPFFFGAACECGSTKDKCLSPHCHWCEDSKSCVIHKEDCGKKRIEDENNNKDGSSLAENEKDAELAADTSGDLSSTGGSSPHSQSNSAGGTFFFLLVIASIGGAVYYAKQKKMFMFADGTGDNEGAGVNLRGLSSYRNEASYDELETGVEHADDEDVGYDVRDDGWRSGSTFVSVN